MSGRDDASDATYHHRHTRRSRRRAERIAANIDGPVTVLDVGCNVGITSRHLLEAGIASQVTGIELEATTVAHALRRDERFNLIEGDVTTVALPDRHDVVIYGAVHHHVMKHNGLAAAVSAFQRLADVAGRTLFFETGHLSEGGRWPWQRAIRRYFSSDEEHLHYLLSGIEHLLIGFEVIGRYWIHGARRAYLRIDLKPPEQRAAPLVPAPPVDIALPGGAGLGRTFGSRGQRLLPAEEAGDSPTWFSRCRDAPGGPRFLKRHLHRPLAAAREYAIGSQLRAAWAVRADGVAADGATLVFPLIDGTGLADQRQADAATRRSLAAALCRVHADAATARIAFEPQTLLRVPAETSLADVCDLHLNNLLVTGEGATARLHVVDFEQQGTNCRARNRLHLARGLWLLRTRRARAAAAWLHGVAGLLFALLADQLLPFPDRVRDRRPALLSLAVVRIRGLTGRVFGRLLRAAGIE